MHTEEGSAYASDAEEKQKKEDHYVLSAKWINVKTQKSIVLNIVSMSQRQRVCGTKEK
jgi:hypothetical protein